MPLPKHVVRGLVWIVVGAGVYGYSLATDTPIVIRGTEVPWGLVVVGIGLLLMGWDAWQLARKRRAYERDERDQK